MKPFLKFLLISFICWSCAQRVPPSGGKKDTISPKLVSSIPIHQSKNYKGKTVELIFDEYIKVENINQNLLITPSIDKAYSTKIKPNGVRITFPDGSLKENTTYSLNFRSTFKDITENNEAKNIKIVFSTGTEIDSLKIKGTVKKLQTNQPVFDTMVGLYKYSDTLNIRKEKPYYLIKTDSTGQYQIENIQKGTYKIYAFEDKNNNSLYNESVESIAYIDDKLEIDKNIENQNLNLVYQNKQELKIVRTTTSVRYATVSLNRPMKHLTLNFKTEPLPYLIEGKDLKIFNTINTVDTVKYEIVAKDSADISYNLPSKLIFKKAVKKTDGAKEELKFDIEPKPNSAIENNINYILKFNKPIAKVNLDKIIILEDTLKKYKITDSILVWNQYKNEAKFKINTRSKNLQRFSLEPTAFISVENDSTKKFNQENTILNSDETGIITGEITKANGIEIIQLLDENYKVLKEVYYQKKYKFNFIPPGKYWIRIIEDRNKNGYWDAGNYEKNINPENIIYFKDKIQIKANFELSGFNF